LYSFMCRSLAALTTARACCHHCARHNTGFYAIKGSRKPCKRCAFGRSTADSPLLQRVFTDCLVLPGYGAVSSAAGATTTDGSGYLNDTSALTPEQQASLTVLACPVGYYGPGNSLGAVCTKCPTGSTTPDVGATSSSQCSSERARVHVCCVGCGDGVCGCVTGQLSRHLSCTQPALSAGCCKP
jgi:hypothetical protein